MAFAKRQGLVPISLVSDQLRKDAQHFPLPMQMAVAFRYGIFLNMIDSILLLLLFFFVLSIEFVRLCVIETSCLPAMTGAAAGVIKF